MTETEAVHDSFIAGSRWWDQNEQEGRTLKAVPAALYTPAEQPAPGIAIVVAGKPRIVVPVNDAIRLAHNIADAAQRQKEQNQ